MRKIVTSTFITMDGIMQGPSGPEEDENGHFAAGGWSNNHWDSIVSDAMGEIFAPHPDLLLGRKTYEIFAGYWPLHPDEPGADNLNKPRKYVVSQTLDKLEWENSTLIKGDVVQQIRTLKASDGAELQVHGSSNLIQTLLKHNLIDEMHMLIFPVALGNGKRFFGEGTNPSDFKLLTTKISTTGVIIAKYELNGAFKTASFA